MLLSQDARRKLGGRLRQKMLGCVSAQPPAESTESWQALPASRRPAAAPATLQRAAGGAGAPCRRGAPQARAPA